MLPGGGIVRAVLSQGQPLSLCDVGALTLPSFDSRGGRNGVVRFAYAQVAAGGQIVHGWVMLGYRRTGRAFRRTLTLDA